MIQTQVGSWFQSARLYRKPGNLLPDTNPYTAVDSINLITSLSFPPTTVTLHF